MSRLLLKFSFPVASFLLLFFACQSPQEIKRDQYFVEGMELYKVHCANCHQRNGQGLVDLYPPLAGADYLTAANKARIICAIRYGQADSLVVNGKRYTQPMPGNTQLQALDVAEITTYIYNQWGGEKTLTETDSVRKVLEKCSR
ncbi:MAG: c-type cytochrome [Sphingobacteriaceae bacterium]|nr:c-type cytochrome [Cytophagaceae bacterium]